MGRLHIVIDADTERALDEVLAADPLLSKSALCRRGVQLAIAERRGAKVVTNFMQQAAHAEVAASKFVQQVVAAGGDILGDEVVLAAPSAPSAPARRQMHEIRRHPVASNVQFCVQDIAEVLGIKAADVLLELDDEDVTRWDGLDYVAAFGCSTAVAVALRGDVPQKLTQEFEDWASSQS